jgi:hypothetical protein
LRPTLEFGGTTEEFFRAAASVAAGSEIAAPIW